jgi:hypothetical protein
MVNGEPSRFPDLQRVGDSVFASGARLADALQPRERWTFLDFIPKAFAGSSQPKPWRQNNARVRLPAGHGRTGAEPEWSGEAGEAPEGSGDI